MHAGETEELLCSHALRVVLHRVPCSCQQCFHVLLQKAFSSLKVLVRLLEEHVDSSFFVNKL